MLHPFFFSAKQVSIGYRKIKCLFVLLWNHSCKSEATFVYELGCSQWALSDSVMTLLCVREEDTAPEHSELGVAKGDWHQSTWAWYFLCLTPVPSPCWPCDCLLSCTAEADRWMPPSLEQKLPSGGWGLSYREKEYFWSALLIWPSSMMMCHNDRKATESQGGLGWKGPQRSPSSNSPAMDGDTSH